MLGPEILANTLSVATHKGVSDRQWQYHSRSDRHSKVACWTVLLDLLLECDVFKKHASEGKLGFALNHVIVGKIPKTLDLVICRIPPRRRSRVRRTFQDLAKTYEIQLTAEDALELQTLPELEEEQRDDVSEVLVALEAKACMTEHTKSIPRLFAEVLATGYLAKRAQVPITACHIVVNSARSFVTPSSGGKINEHNQPHDAQVVVEMVGAAIPTTHEFEFGYDAIGVTVVDCKNDGSRVSVVTGVPAPDEKQAHHSYSRMIRHLCLNYRQRFGASP